jgi:GTP-binding protein HflX
MHRAVHRVRRAAAPLPVIALCGYTSAGKSSLTNQLSGADIRVDPMLFSTLDPTTRRAQLPSGQAVLITDTVGFIAKLPTQLVASFRATLEEIEEASLILHVVDASREDFAPHMAAVNAVLAQLGGAENIPVIVVWNKVDLAADAAVLRRQAAASTQPTVCVSALTGEGLPELWERMKFAIEQQTLVSLEVLLPFAEGHMVGKMRRLGAVEREEFQEAGIYVQAKVPSSMAGQLRQWRLS